MKEIDFLPEWYKSGRRRKVSYRTQYVALGGIFVVMVAWNAVTSYSVSKASAKLRQMTTQQAQADEAVQEFEKVRSELIGLQKKANVLNAIDSRIDVVSVLGEMSALVDTKVVLSKVELRAEKFKNTQEDRPSATGVRAAGGGPFNNGMPLLGEVRFRVLISGVASDASAVTELVVNLEESPYFSDVVPLLQNGMVSAGGRNALRNYQVSRFEISCYLANYRESIAGR